MCLPHVHAIARAALFIAVSAGSTGVAAIDGRALANGTHRWIEAPAARAGSLGVIVSIDHQLLLVYRDGRLIGMSSVSTGSVGHETPRGQFTILQKKKWHRSNLYSAAPMPHMQRLTWDGIALHGGHLPGFPASHGCIRLPPAFAAQLFEITRPGMPVTVRQDFTPRPVYLLAAPVPWDSAALPVSVPASRPRIGAPPLSPPRLPYDLRIYMTGPVR